MFFFITVPFLLATAAASPPHIADGALPKPEHSSMDGPAMPDDVQPVGDEAEKQQAEHLDIYTKLKEQIPDPAVERETIKQELKRLIPLRPVPETATAEEKYYSTILEYLESIDREKSAELSLLQVIEETLANSYTIEYQSFNPAISATRVVEAESIFDMLFFSTADIIETNQPTPVALQSSDSSNRTFDTGLSKLLPTGMTVSTEYIVNRRKDEDFQFALINPSYRNQWRMSLRQPLLRGFGLDYNRSQIEITQNDRSRSEYEFQRLVRDQLVSVERAYWTLAGARRTLVIDARLIAEFQRIYDHLWARRDFDASPVEITQSKARLDERKAIVLRSIANVKDAEDQLKNLINDPNLDMAEQIEIIPTEFPTANRMIVDRLAELQAALDNRVEIREARLGIDTASIAVGAAKNQALPRFDVSFSYTYDGLGASQGDAWENLGDFDFHTYTVGLEFEWPIGNRGPRAALRRARLQHAQSEAFLRQTIEGIILDVNLAIRELETTYELIGANLITVESQQSQVKAIEDRAERRDPDQLNRELNARTGLATARSQLVDSLLRYNFAITELERAKGTLLQYNNISIVDSTTEKTE